MRDDFEQKLPSLRDKFKYFYPSMREVFAIVNHYGLDSFK